MAVKGEAAPVKGSRNECNKSFDANEVSSFEDINITTGNNALLLLLHLQQTIIDCYSWYYVKSISPVEAQGMLTLMNWGLR
jgi:hypothetical protein